MAKNLVKAGKKVLGRGEDGANGRGGARGKIGAGSMSGLGGGRDATLGVARNLRAVEAGAASGGEEQNDIDDATEQARKNERGAGGYFTGVGRSLVADKKKSGGLKGKFKKRAAVVAILLVMVGAIAYIILSPMIKIATIGYNLKRALGFDSTSAILEEQAEYITAEMLAKGKVPEEYAGDLADVGIEVGQVTVAGEFVRTNSYIAGLDESREVAAEGEYYSHDEDGELAVRFNGEVVKAGDFVLAVESNPEMYAAYEKAVDIKARYYYSDEVNAVYKNMGISRGMFNGWESTGDAEADAASFQKMLEEGLNVDASALLSVVGEEEYDCSYAKTDENGNAVLDDNGEQVMVEETCTRQVEDEENAKSKKGATEIIAGVRSKTKGRTINGATEKASQLLNVAVSSVEPYEAANAFMAVEEAIEMAQVGNNGPINETMNALTESTEISYMDVNTGAIMTKNVSILETENFVAAVAEEPYSVTEADNFSRDRVLNVTKAANGAVIKDTTMALQEKNKKSRAVLWVEGKEVADGSTLSRTEDSISKALTQDNSELFKSVVGGNRVVEGGSFISNSLNARTLGAMPSDEATIMAYHQEVKEVFARRAEADRATLSPLDISSPNTLLGSLVRKVAMASLSGSVKSQSAISGVAATVGLAGDSLTGLVSGVMADGAGNGSDYETVIGNCDTVGQAANVKGDLYCTSHNTIYTGKMKNTKEDWQSELGENLSGGEINKSSGLAEFVTLGMSRDVTVGVKSSEVCETWKDNNQTAWGKLKDAILGALGLYQSCEGVPSGVADGGAYTLSNSNGNTPENGGVGGVENIKKYSGYVLYDTVSSLLEGSQSSVARFREEYYKEHPLDNSVAGRIARISGMTRDEAEVALAYADYLNVIAQYNAAERYAFGIPVAEKPVLPIGEKLAVNDGANLAVLEKWGVEKPAYILTQNVVAAA